jgi:hypothetical protein
MTWRGMLLAAAFTGLTVASLSADTISGSFNIDGTIIVTQNTIDWQTTSGGILQKATIGSGATGSFAGLDGTTITIEDLDRTTEPVGSTFGPDLFVSFDARPSLAPLNINMIFNGLYTAAGCLAAPPQPGQSCTPGPPITPSSSPFNFVNNPPAPGQATATFAFSGVEGTSSTWNGNFTSQFGVPFQTVLSDFQGNGSVSNTYSATFTVTSTTPVPETSSLSLLGLGLALVMLSRSGGVINRLRRQG